MSRDTGIADRLRKAGCKVVEIDGWKTRGSSTFSPRGSLDHHTAGAARGNAHSLGICINGRPDLPGPLCHVLVGRDLTCYVIAAGRANHAGAGGWKGLTGNSSVFGVERENVGTAAEPWRPEQTIHAATVHRALMNGKSADLVCRHAEWAPNRKTDTHSVSGTQLRALVATPPTPVQTPEEDDEMGYIIYLKDTRAAEQDYQRYYDVKEKPLVEGVHIYSVVGVTATYCGAEGLALAKYLSGGKVSIIGTSASPELTINADGKANLWFMSIHCLDGPLAGIKK